MTDEISSALRPAIPPIAPPPPQDVVCPACGSRESGPRFCTQCGVGLFLRVDEDIRLRANVVPDNRVASAHAAAAALPDEETRLRADVNVQLARVDSRRPIRATRRAEEEPAAAPGIADTLATNVPAAELIAVPPELRVVPTLPLPGPSRLAAAVPLAVSLDVFRVVGAAWSVGGELIQVPEGAVGGLILLQAAAGKVSGPGPWRVRIHDGRDQFDVVFDVDGSSQVAAEVVHR